MQKAIRVGAVCGTRALCNYRSGSRKTFDDEPRKPHDFRYDDPSGLKSTLRMRGVYNASPQHGKGFYEESA